MGGMMGTPCENACTKLFNCAVIDQPMDLCPGLDEDSRMAFIEGCIPTCADNPALRPIVEQQDDCTQLVNTLKGLSPAFADSCTDEGGMGGAGGGPGAPTEEEIQAIFNANCNGCHIGGESGELSLAAPFTADTVGVPSSQANLNRIEPGDRDASYLFLKITGRHLEAGGSGGRMPLGGAPLAEEEIEAIGQYIDSLE